MDGPRFDAWTRTLAARTDRRHLLAAAFGLGVGWLRQTDAAAPTPAATPVDAVPPGPYPTPLAEPFGTCPETGEGGDPDLNTLKNRDDTAESWLPVTIGAILALPVPEGTTRFLRNWPDEAVAEVGP